MKKNFLWITLLAAAGLMAGCKEVDEHTMTVNRDWKFQRLENPDDPADGFQALEFDDSAWTTVDLPHSGYLEPLVITDQWQGVVWYRKDFEVDESLADKKIWLTLEGAMSQSKIWINGELAKEREGGYLPVVVDATDYVKPGQKNTVAIRLDSRDNPYTGPKPMKRLDFCMYSGLYRNVLVTMKEKVYISHPVLADKEAGGGIFITYPEVSAAKSTVQVKTHVVNEKAGPQTIQVAQKVLFKGKTVAEKVSEPVVLKTGKDVELTESFQLSDAPLWSVDEPNLHTMKTTVLVDGKAVDSETTRFGIRKLEFRNGHEFYLNGKKMYLRGTNRHQDYPFIGYALSDAAQYRDAKKIKEAGFNVVRLSHYPHSPAFMDACDELGLLTLDAIMGWQYYLDDDRFREYCYRSSRELVRRDRNRPSVLAWEVSLNETKDMPDSFIEELHRLAHAEYPGDNTFTAGWIDHAWDIFLQARQHRIMHDYHKNLDKPYFVSEYGDWEYYSNNAGLNQDRLDKDRRLEMSSRQARGFGEARLLQQAHNLQEAYNDNLNTHAFGDGYWVFNDYNRGYAEDIEYSGVVDIFRIPKFAYYFYQSQRDPAQGAMAHVASWWTKDSPLNVKVFSNCDEVELFLNGASLGKQKPDTGKNTENLGHPPFTFALSTFKPGTLKAVGYINGKPAAEHLVRTPGKPVKLEIVIDESGIAPQAGVNDTVFAYIQAVDEHGTVDPTYADVVMVEMDGDATVLNTDALMAEAGIATALLQIEDGEGDITLTASSGNLSGSLTFKAE
ncbi:glycoside hydrolase family 2 protein [Pontiella agarivorans]|uniref:Glycoside hydrolase family 2 TIM barrel-domain containing protein n=1 Tax=Pontiella agarivorans TaxID=3038953 RepID=A0ABU5MW24_9BACT|nr:glycoside hydrolase family 2 TIM barrel-domain containing protein [Pontiella agarivorans]MDZ8118394.1 glycoside hydrolase family 2 TIM barrel-domain containing protein [Pontiella agarivorans]